MSFSIFRVIQEARWSSSIPRVGLRSLAQLVGATTVQWKDSHRCLQESSSTQIGSIKIYRSATFNITRSYRILVCGPDQCDQILRNFATLAKVQHVVCKYLTVYFLFGKTISLLWQICDIIGLIFIIANGKILKNNLTIWSRWSRWTDEDMLGCGVWGIKRGWGGSPGLVVKGGDSQSEGCEFKSQCRILDKHFSHSYLM